MGDRRARSGVRTLPYDIDWLTFRESSFRLHGYKASTLARIRKEKH